MRIIAGKYRAKQIYSPSNLSVRPTSDRAREALFSILYSHFGSMEGKSVLDIFAGTGALGLEALSRGAQKVCFVDINTQTLLQNIQLFEKEKNKIEFIKTDVRNLKPFHQKFDFIFSDPPYDQGLNEKAFEQLLLKGALKKGTVCVVESRKNEEIFLADAFDLIEERVYGMAKIRIYVFEKNA